MRITFHKKTPLPMTDFNDQSNDPTDDDFSGSDRSNYGSEKIMNLTSFKTKNKIFPNTFD